MLNIIFRQCHTSLRFGSDSYPAQAISDAGLLAAADSTPDLSSHHYTHLVPIPTLTLYIYSLCHLSFSVIVNVACFPEYFIMLHFGFRPAYIYIVL